MILGNRSGFVRTTKALAAAASLAAALLAPGVAQADLLWNWNMAGDGIAANGSFTTTDTLNSDGYYALTSITGTRNGVVITGLEPAGNAIPLNDGYPVDNLIDATGNLTGNGIGFTLADGSYSNPYYASWDSPPDYFEVFTLPATSTFSEVGVTFAATAVPEPGAIAVFGIGLLLLSVPVARARRQQSRNPKA